MRFILCLAALLLPSIVLAEGGGRSGSVKDCTALSDSTAQRDCMIYFEAQGRGSDDAAGAGGTAGEATGATPAKPQAEGAGEAPTAGRGGN